MEAAIAPLAPNRWGALSAEAQRLIEGLQAQVLALQTEAATPHTRIGELEARGPRREPASSVA